MAFPIPPSDWRTIVPGSTGKLCAKLVKSLIGGMSKILTIITWGVNEDGSASDALRAWLNLSSSGSIQAPTQLAAVGAATEIGLSWDAVAAATSYDLYRSTSPLAPTVGVTAPLIAGLATNSYVDTGVSVGIAYYYWVVARNTSGVSGLSNMATGMAGGGASTQTFTYGGANIQSVVVPAGMTSADITAYAGGGGGGGAYNQGPFGQPGNQRAGGGGGSGSKETKTLAVVAGTTLTLYVANGGTGGSYSSPNPGGSGGNGEASYVKNPAGGVECSANGGIGGGGGVPGSNGAGGAAGTGGTGDVNTPGTAGTAGSGEGPTATGGAGGAANPGSTNNGGQGGSFGAGNAGEPGLITITFS